MEYEHLQVKVLYSQYGWDVAAIAKAIDRPITYVQQLVNENSMVKASNIPALFTTDPNAENADQEQDELVQKLQSQEIRKQAELAPLSAITEIMLLSKITEAAALVETHLPDSSSTLLNLVKAFKQLTQDSVTTKVVNDDQGKPGIAVQVVTHIT